MSRQEQIKKALERKFNGKNEYNFDDFFGIMQDYAFILWDNDTNYKNEMKNIFDEFILNDNGYAKRDDIIKDLPDIIVNTISPVDGISSHNGGINDDNDYKSNENTVDFKINDGFYAQEISKLKKQIERMEIERLQHETEYNVLKEERIEYENAYNKVLNELNEYKNKDNELDFLHETLNMVRESSSIINTDNIELSNNYDELKRKYLKIKNKNKLLSTELDQLKTLNNELKSVNDNFVKINENITSRNSKNEAELNALRNMLTEIENEITEAVNNPDNNEHKTDMKHNSDDNSSHFQFPTLNNHLRTRSSNVDTVNNIFQYHVAKTPRTPHNLRKASNGLIRLSSKFFGTNALTIDVDDDGQYDDEIDEQQLRTQIEDELKLQYQTQMDQMNVKHKIKINEFLNQLNSLQNDNVSLSTKVLKLEKDIKNKKYELDSSKNSIFCRFLFPRNPNKD